MCKYTDNFVCIKVPAGLVDALQLSLLYKTTGAPGLEDHSENILNDNFPL